VQVSCYCYYDLHNYYHALLIHTISFSFYTDDGGIRNQNNLLDLSDCDEEECDDYVERGIPQLEKADYMPRSQKSGGLGGRLFGGGPAAAAVPAPRRLMMKSAMPRGASLPAPALAVAPGGAPVVATMITAASSSTTQHVVVNAPTNSKQQPQQQQQQQSPEYDYNNEEQQQQQVMDVTKLPTLLESLYDKQQTSSGAVSSVRPTILHTGAVWTKETQASLLATPETETLSSEEQEKEKAKAPELLDALSRSGALVLGDQEYDNRNNNSSNSSSCSCQLHVIVPLTHAFDRSLMNAVVQQNCNVIEEIERASCWMARAIHSNGNSSGEDNSNSLRWEELLLTSGYARLQQSKAGLSLLKNRSLLRFIR
jgi:hypothetical protein